MANSLKRRGSSDAKSPTRSAKAIGIYESCSHISQRFPGLKGRELQNAIFQKYLFEPEKGANHLITAKWFCDDGSRSLVRHPRINQERGENVTQTEMFRDVILEEGLYQGLGGSIWAVPDGRVIDGKRKYMLLTAGSRADGFYAAVDADKSNKQVQACLGAGSPPMLLFEPNTPDDVLVCMRDMGKAVNDVNVPTSFIENFKVMPTIQSLWEEHCQKHKISARKQDALSNEAKEKGAPEVPGYRNLFFAFVEERWPHRFAVNNDFYKCKIAWGKLQEKQLFEALTQYAQKHCVFKAGIVQKSALYPIISEIISQFDTRGIEHMCYAIEALKLALPTNDDAPYCLIENAHKDRVKALFAPAASACKVMAFCKTKIGEVQDIKRMPTILDEILHSIHDALQLMDSKHMKWEVMEEAVRCMMVFAFTKSLSVVLDDQGKATAVRGGSTRTSDPKGKAKAKPKPQRVKRMAAGTADEEEVNDEEIDETTRNTRVLSSMRQVRALLVQRVLDAHADFLPQHDQGNGSRALEKEELAAEEAADFASGLQWIINTETDLPKNKKLSDQLALFMSTNIKLAEPSLCGEFHPGLIQMKVKVFSCKYEFETLGVAYEKGFKDFQEKDNAEDFKMAATTFGNEVSKLLYNCMVEQLSPNCIRAAAEIYSAFVDERVPEQFNDCMSSHPTTKEFLKAFPTGEEVERYLEMRALYLPECIKCLRDHIFTAEHFPASTHFFEIAGALTTIKECLEVLLHLFLLNNACLCHSTYRINTSVSVIDLGHLCTRDPDRPRRRGCKLGCCDRCHGNHAHHWRSRIFQAQRKALVACPHKIPI